MKTITSMVIKLQGQLAKYAAITGKLIQELGIMIILINDENDKYDKRVGGVTWQLPGQ